MYARKRKIPNQHYGESRIGHVSAKYRSWNAKIFSLFL